MQPSGNRYGSNIYQGGSTDYGRSVSPNWVEYVINNPDTPPITQGNGNILYTNGTVDVITNSGGDVVTIITH